MINSYNIFPYILLFVVFFLIIKNFLPKNYLGRIVIYMFVFIMLELGQIHYSIYVLYLFFADTFITVIDKTIFNV